MRQLAAIILCPLLFAACATHRPVADEPVVPLPYVRVVDDGTNLVQLQMAVRKFVPARSRGPAIWLVSASHIGDPAYYRELQARLSRPTLVLFEGIRPDADSPPRFVDTNSASSDLGTLQQTAARSLGLVFQLDAINYHCPNFRNSDLSVAELQQLLAQPAAGGTAAQGEFNSLVSAMQGDTLMGYLINTILRFIGSDTKLRAEARLVLIEMLGQLRGDLSQLQNLPPALQRLLQTLIDSRNQKVLSDLKPALRRVPSHGSIALFYGTAHMDNLEQRLCAELHYRSVADEWLTVCSVDLEQSGISPVEAQSIRWFARKQMEKFQPQP